jgi:hypothetical protein
MQGANRIGIAVGQHHAAAHGQALVQPLQQFIMICMPGIDLQLADPRANGDLVTLDADGALPAFQ